MKSLLKNPNLHVFVYKAPRKSQRAHPDPGHEQNESALYYKELGIDSIEGPYCYPGSTRYRIDAIYHYYDSHIYSVFLKDVFKTKEPRLFPVHEYISYNQKTFGAKFIKYWQSMCTLLPLKTPINSVIFVDGKYLYISWIPEIAYSYAYPGYENLVDICGGKQIDINAKYDKFTSFRNIKMVSNTMWYVAYGETYELVSVSTSNFAIISAINFHIRKHRSHKLLDIELQTIPKKLKLANYGDAFKFKCKLIDHVWYDVLSERLMKYNVPVVPGGYKKKCRVTPADSHHLFEWLWQKEKYFEREFENGEMMFITDMEMSFNLKSYYLSIDGIQLKQDEEGYTYGLEQLNNGQYGLYSVLLYLELEIQFHILDYLCIYDLTIIRSVCMELKELCEDKVKDLYYPLLSLPEEIQFHLFDYLYVNDLRGIGLICPELKPLCLSKLRNESFSQFQHK